MISGERPDTPVATTRASGVSPSSFALRSLMTTTAAAPSLSGQQLPAVMVPFSRKTGLRACTPSSVTPGRGPSSLLTTVPSARVTGAISRSKKPSAMAFSARFWLVTPHSSCRSREMPRSVATFSAVCPIERYTSGTSPSDLGSVHVALSLAICSLRALAAANLGFWASSEEPPAPAQLVYWETHSTPPEMKMSPSPALMAW